MQIIKVPISKCKNWDKNPRGITKDDFARLKKQIQKLGLYKPLVAYEDSGEYIVLGGNMRLRAIRDLKHHEVDVSIVTPKTEAEKLELSLSDNDRAWYYEEDKLQELVYSHKEEIELPDYKVDLKEPVLVSNLLQTVTPNEKEINEDSIEVDNECPKCGYKW